VSVLSMLLDGVADTGTDEEDHELIHTHARTHAHKITRTYAHHFYSFSVKKPHLCLERVL
jgi:hypothetical protein